MAAEGKQQELERANLEEIVTKIEADTVPAAESCGARLKRNSQPPLWSLCAEHPCPCLSVASSRPPAGHTQPYAAASQGPAQPGAVGEGHAHVCATAVTPASNHQVPQASRVHAGAPT